jgi:hypothetical protein
MKSLKKYILVFAVAAMLFSCSDFLEVTPQGQLTTDVYFSTEESIDDAVARVYSSINWRFFRLGTMYFTTHEFCSDDVRMNTTDANFMTPHDFINNADNVYVQRLWERWYGYLNDCNQVLELTKDYTGEKADLYNAQSRYFRAYYHFDLINIFGEVVLRDHVPSSDEYNLPKSTEDEIYALIIGDLEYAVQHLPTRSQWGVENLGRVTKGTAKGLLAKVYLYRQDYDNAYKYANEIVNTDGEYSLDPSYRNLFAPDNTYSAENMMPGHYIYQNITGRVRNPYVEFQGIPGSGLGSCYFVPSDDFVNAYESGDPRKEATLFSKGETIEGYAGDINWAEGFEYANKKSIFPATGWPNNDFFSQELNLPFLRFADVLLIYAEAANELGKTAEAHAALEKLRFRARGNKTFDEAGVLPIIATSDKAALRELIWKERRIELSFEGNRWFDLVRYEKVVPGYTSAIMSNSNKTNFTYKKSSKFPIPSMYITSSEGVLVQNPEW